MQKRWVSTGTVFLFALLACTWATALQAAEEAAPKAAFAENSWRFEPVFEGEEVVHDFVVKNEGTAPLEITKVQTS